jgi:predicted transcriptional regulator of viral defense system
MPANPAQTHVIRTKLRGRAADHAIADLAERQHGIVARRQLVGQGVSERAIAQRLADRQLRLVRRGVYATGHAGLTRDAWAMAAVLFAGPGALLSHRSAAALWGMAKTPPSRAEVTVPRERRQCRAVRFHYGLIAPDEITTHRGIPVTGVARTQFDLAAIQSPARVAAAMAEAEVLRLTDTLSIHDLLERYPGRRGSAAVRAILREIRAATGRTRSELELAFLEFLDRVGLSRPEMNVWLRVGNEWIEADCVWREQRVIAELDSQAVHLTPEAFERDRARDRRLAVHERRPIRVTWRHVHQEPRALESDLRTLLAA